MRKSNFAYYCFLGATAIVVVLMFTSVSNSVVNSKKLEVEKQSEIICQHPAGHVIKYKVSGDNARYPLNMKGSMWSFNTVEGKHIISTFCHREID